MKDYPYVPGWRLNKENNKPAVKHSVLMLTRHGVAEGEWNGNEWVQYRWSCKVKDSDVLYWIHLEDLMQLEKEGDLLQQEQPKRICPHCVYLNKPDDVCEYHYGGRDCLINENGVYKCNGFEGVEQQEQLEVDLEKGETINTEILLGENGKPYIHSFEVYDYNKNIPLFLPGTEVTLQIRKVEQNG